MNSPNALSDTALDEKLIIFETEESPEPSLDETILEKSFVSDLDNLPEGTNTPKFPEHLPHRMTRKREQRSFLDHNHALVTINDIQSCPRPRWFLNHRSIKPTDLANLTTEFSKRTLEHWIPLQRRTWDEFSTNDGYNLKSGDVSDFKMIRFWGYLFDGFFFFGSMRRFLTVGIGEMKKVCGGHCIEEAYSTGQAPGSYALEHTKCQINIQISTEPDRKIRLTQYLSRLLHQMVHAYIALFACRLGSCRTSPWERGTGHHGMAFQDIAFGVEKGAEMFGLKLDLMREISFAHELASEWLVPGNTISFMKDMLGRWKFDEKRLRKQRSAIRTGMRPPPGCYRFSLYEEALFS